MASKGYDKDSLLPRRDREQGREDIEAQRRAESIPASFEVGNDPNRPSHPDGWQSGGR